ncbi:hypothetical protein EDB81DRAFT_657879, partial [Dactylonectria macrodidyma]
IEATWLTSFLSIVAVHGLNGHREKTWTAKAGTNIVNWLRDLSPADIPNARVIVWGYDAHTHSKSRLSCQYLYDHARALVSDLCLLRARTDALIHSDASRQGSLEHHRSIKVSTHGIIFMGTPHQGGNNVTLGQLLTSIASIFMEADDRILQHLQRDSEWLQQQLGQCSPISNEFVTKFAYEEYETATKLGHKMVVNDFFLLPCLSRESLIGELGGPSFVCGCAGPSRCGAYRHSC